MYLQWPCRCHVGLGIAYVIHKHKAQASYSHVDLHVDRRIAMRLHNLQEKAPLQIDFVHVDGQYRVGKLLGFSESGAPTGNSDSLTLL